MLVKRDDSYVKYMIFIHAIRIFCSWNMKESVCVLLYKHKKKIEAKETEKTNKGFSW